MSVPTEDKWHFIGKHAVRFEPPDIVCSRPDGDSSIEDLRQIASFIASLPQPERGFFMIISTDKGGRMNSGGLKLPEVQVMNRSQRAVAYLNARFYQRTLVDIFQRAAKLLNISTSNAIIGFFDTEAEARAWIDTLRQEQ